MASDLPQAWREDALVSLDEGTAPGLGCYTTGLWTGRDIRWSTPVVDRLARDAAALGYGVVDTLRAAFSMHALGACAFGTAEGIVRFEARPGGDAEARLVGTARPLGNHAAAAKAGISATVHPGPHPKAPGAKLPRPEIDAARVERDERGLDEIFLFDAEGFLVEGSRCNVLLTLADGSWATPLRAHGGVFGVALELCLERVPEIRERALGRADLLGAREILLTNAARGAFPVVEVEGVSHPAPPAGTLATRLADALSD